KESAKIITDSAPNYLKDGRLFHHLKCICHLLNTAIEKAHIETLEKNLFYKFIESRITYTIGFINYTNRQKELSIKLKSGSTTRPWKRLSNKAASMSASYYKLVEIFTEINQKSKIDLISKSFVVELEKVFDELESHNVTNNKIIPFYQQWKRT
ncbi:MAG: hypothetical protein MHPSP_004520, partial [Paramarteilia canceri]